MTVTLFSTPSCRQCTATARSLTKAGVPFSTVDLTVDDAAFQKVKALGYQQAPVVIAGADHWSGFRPDRIDELAQLVSAGE